MIMCIKYGNRHISIFTQINLKSIEKSLRLCTQMNLRINCET